MFDTRSGRGEREEQLGKRGILMGLQALEYMYMYDCGKKKGPVLTLWYDRSLYWQNDG